MSIYIKLIGGAIILLLALYVSRSYEKFLRRRIAEYRGLAELISHAEGRISDFLSYGSRLWQGFGDEALEACGLLSSLREGEGLASAFEKCKGKMSLPRKAMDGISERLRKLGGRYKESELTVLRELGEWLSSELRSAEEQSEKNIKVARALLLGGALAVLIIGL